MPPRLVHSVMHRTVTVRALLGRTPEPGTTIKPQIQIQLGNLGVELSPCHPPRPAQPQRRSKQPQLIHTLQPPATRPSRTVTQPTKRSPPRQPATPGPHSLDHQTHLKQRGTEKSLRPLRRTRRRAPGLENGNTSRVPAPSLTWDQGKEMVRHAEFIVCTSPPVYFRDPHSPWHHRPPPTSRAGPLPCPHPPKPQLKARSECLHLRPRGTITNVGI